MNRRIRLAAFFSVVFLTTLYFFSLIANGSSTITILSSPLPFLLKIHLFFQAPYLTYLNTSLLAFFIFLVNILLTSIYIFQIRYKLEIVRALRSAYGLSGSFLSILSVGCVACGSFITPTALLLGLGIPFSALSPLTLGVGLFGTGLLILGNIVLYRHIRPL